MLESFKQRDIFQVHMLQQAQAVIDAEDSQMKMYRSKFHEQKKDLEDLKKLLVSKNEKIQSLEENKALMEEKLKGYTIWKEKYHGIMKQIESQQSEIRKLKNEKKEMSMIYHKELTVQKMQATMFLKQANERHLNLDNQVSVTFYDTLTGVDEETVKMLNEKLEEVKQQAQFKLAAMVQEVERKEEQIQRYKALAPEMYSLAQFDVEEIVKNLPVICDDMDKLWNLFHEVYGEDCFTSNIVRKFPAQFTGDLKQQREQYKALQDRFDDQIKNFEEVTAKQVEDVRIELQVALAENQKLERFYQSIRASNEEHRSHLESRNMEFVEWRKGVASGVYKDLTTQQHIEKEVVKIKSRHESILEKLRVQIQEMAEKICSFEHQIEM